MEHQYNALLLTPDSSRCPAFLHLHLSHSSSAHTADQLYSRRDVSDAVNRQRYSCPKALVPTNMRSPPKDVVASWPAPNYDDPVTRGPALVIVEIIALCISTVCLGLRLFVRIHILRSPDWDDWLMVAAAASAPFQLLLGCP